MRWEPRRWTRLQVARFELATPHLHPAHDGLTVAHLTDLHLRGRRPSRRLTHAVEQVNRAAPDFILLTGDYVCFSAKRLGPLREALSALAGPAFATLGNHDHWTDPEGIRAALEQAGITVLANAHATVRFRGVPLHFVGLDDRITGHADPEQAFRHVSDDGGTRLVLSHDPRGADLLHGRRAAVILSGHTHGGQVNVPGITRPIALRLGVKYLRGSYDVGSSVLYVNRGLGASFPLRVGAPSELALITLRAARVAAA